MFLNAVVVLALLSCGLVWSTENEDDTTVRPVCDIMHCIVSNANLSAVTLDMPRVIRSLEFDNCTVNKFPRAVFEPYIFLQTLNLSHAHLQELVVGDFQEGRRLEYLFLSHNDLKIVKSKVFNGTYALVSVDLSHNAIEVIENEAFSSDFKILRHLDLSSNKIKSLNDNVFSRLVTLSTLNLAYNALQVIQDGIFLHNIWLEELNLSDNDLMVVQENSFSSFTNLNTLEMTGDSLHTISTKNGSIEILKCRDSNVKFEIGKYTTTLDFLNVTVKDLKFDDPEKITEIKIVNGKFSNLDFLNTTTKLKSLDLSFSNIDVFSAHAFGSLETLFILRLVNVGLPQIDYGTFSHNPSLRIVDISYNQLGNIDLEMLAPIKRVNELYIDGNNLTEIGDITLYFPSLRTIGISDNLWNCSYLHNLVKTIQSYDVDILIDPDKRVRRTTNVNGIFCVNSKNDADNAPTFNPTEHNAIPSIVKETNRLKNDLEDLQTQMKEHEIKMDEILVILEVMKNGNSTRDVPEVKERYSALSAIMSVLLVLLIIVLGAGCGFVFFKIGRRYYMRREGFSSVSDHLSVMSL